MNPFTPFESPIAVLPVDNIDTDQIIPARFLKTTTKEGLGKAVFSDWRYDAAGQPRPDFALNQGVARGAQVLVAGDNFGCGSSREHAPWALTDFGFRAVVSTSFADIFFGNALKNGLLPIKVSPEVHAKLVGQGSGAEVKVDLEAQTLTLADGTAIEFPVDPFSKRCMLMGVDELGYLQQFESEIARFEGGRTAPYDTRSVL
ncbi:3-isopropylmalate dehydratase small subunit [Holophaga foetida]|uniref:3-isopropylmalate dehydratase small subunit n=1 Tax=Holophaga foetida TaxID=35839 RepID=UPI0002473F4A|nr:3-isopropylmalate dehydratase small subunit [Holophaga foetida]